MHQGCMSKEDETEYFGAEDDGKSIPDNASDGSEVRAARGFASGRSGGRNMLL